MDLEHRHAARDEPATVLVCDDDPAVRELVGATLEGRGYRVIAAASGVEALEQAMAQRPDAILLDLLMPRVSGCETVAALKEQAETAEIPIVVLSVLTADYGREVAPAAADWLRKPVDASSLVGALERAMGAAARPSRVVVVEDDLDLAPLLTAMIERQGAEAFHVVTGEAAVELCESVEPDLLLLDLALPEMDGFAVVEWLRRHGRLSDVPIVVFTARDLDASELERLRRGDAEVLRKGRVGPQELQEHLLAVLDEVTRGRGRSR